MEGTRTERRFRPAGLIVTVSGVLLSGLFVSSVVSLLPIGFLTTLFGIVLLVADPAAGLPPDRRAIL